MGFLHVGIRKLALSRSNGLPNPPARLHAKVPSLCSIISSFGWRGCLLRCTEHFLAG